MIRGLSPFVAKLVIFPLALLGLSKMSPSQGIPKPGKTRILAASFGDVTVTRLDTFTLRLRPQDGFFPSDSSKLFRSSSRPYHTGEFSPFWLSNAGGPSLGSSAQPMRRCGYPLPPNPGRWTAIDPLAFSPGTVLVAPTIDGGMTPILDGSAPHDVAFSE